MILKSRGNHDKAFRYFQAGYDVYDIADHLYYAGKCWNEVREYLHKQPKYMYTTNTYSCLCWLYQAPNQENEDIEKLHSECVRVCKHIEISNERPGTFLGVDISVSDTEDDKEMGSPKYESTSCYQP